MTKVEGLFLTPGAGSSADHPSLVAIERAVAPLRVLRHDFPYRREGRRAPDRAPKAIADIREHVPGSSWVLGGRSFGGRMCSMAVAQGQPAAGLILISYPLHPPGKPERLRTEHFPKLSVPCLFVQGTSDPFGSPDELRAAIAAIPARTELIPIQGAGHDLKSGRFDLASVVATALRLCAEITPGRG